MYETDFPPQLLYRLKSGSEIPAPEQERAAEMLIRRHSETQELVPLALTAKEILHLICAPPAQIGDRLVSAVILHTTAGKKHSKRRLAAAAVGSGRVGLASDLLDAGYVRTWKDFDTLLACASENEAPELAALILREQAKRGIKPPKSALLLDMDSPAMLRRAWATAAGPDNTLVITGYRGYGCPVDIILIPAFIGEQRVSGIADYAFSPPQRARASAAACSAVKEIFVPGLIESIGPWAFAGGQRSRLVFLDGRASIPGGSLWNIAGFSEVVLPRTLTSVGENAFAYTREGQQIVLLNSNTQIAEGAWGAYPAPCITGKSAREAHCVSCGRNALRCNECCLHA